MFDNKRMDVSACLKFYFHWLSLRMDTLKQDYDRGQLEGLAAVREALDAGVSEFANRVRELGIILGAEHEFVRYAEAQARYAELMTKGGAIMATVFDREQTRQQAAQIAQAGHWLARAPVQGALAGM